MNKAELIRHEIEKRREHNLAIGNPLFAAMAEEDVDLLCFIDSLQEEPVSEDLEKVANEWNAKASFTPFYMALDDKGNPSGVRQDYTTHAESFKAGAKWNKEQLMAKAIDGIARPDDSEIWCDLKSFNFKDGDKVKVIVIKED